MSEQETIPSNNYSEFIHRNYRYMVALLGVAALMAAGLKISTEMTDSAINKIPAPASSGPDSANQLVRLWQTP